MNLRQADAFFATARERYRIKLNRDAGQPAPWTCDPVFNEWRFCNVHREDDKTTVWFRENVRSHLTGLPVVEATVIFRFFNLISTGERIKDLLLNGWDSEEARRRLQGVAPLVTGAYQIKTVNGLNKLEGALQAIDAARRSLPRMVPRWGQTLRAAWRDLQELPYLGGFMAYEIVSDLRWTPVLQDARDILTWACAGPGATEGLGLVAWNDRRAYNRHSDQDQLAMRDVMVQLLAISRDDAYWPQEWQPWELREVEHWSCEFAKYQTGKAGMRLKRRFAA